MPQTSAMDPRIANLSFQLAWDGTQKAQIWGYPGANQSIQIKDAAKAHSGDVAQEWRAQDGTWVETGMFWNTTFSGQKVKYFGVWVKVTSGKPPQNLNVGWHTRDGGCGKGGFTYPTDLGGVEMRSVNPKWNDGTWQHVVVAADDLTKGSPACKGEIDGIALRGSGSSFTMLFDDIGYYF